MPLVATSFKCMDGHIVRSKGELIIDNYLHRLDIEHEYENTIRVRGHPIKYDWYLPKYKTYIEYWGYHGKKYMKRKEEKLSLYRKGKLKLVSIEDIINSHVLSPENLRLVSKNKITPEILNTIIESPITEEEQTEVIKNIVIGLITKLNKGEKHIEGYSVDITENIPLYTFYQLILDENPNFNITIEQLEEIINSLAEEGYLPGIKIIQEDEDHYLKLVQFKVRDISKNELELISNALKFQSFTLADMVGATGWSSKQVLKILNHLSELGILKYSKNHLHGERWYVVSEKENHTISKM